MTKHPELIDIGANLTHSSFRADLDSVIEQAMSVGVSTMVVTGSNERASQAALEIAQSYAGILYATAGVHPHEASSFTDQTPAALQKLAREEQIVALGEMGLDYNRDYSPRPVQDEVFAAQLELACELDLPVFLHQRDAHERFVAILNQYRSRLGAAVAHCFTGTAEELDTYLDMDLHIGITGWICDERRGLHLRELVSRIPPDRLMIETDSPYLLPRDLKPAPKNRRNVPANLPHILDAVAQCLGKSAEEVAAATTRTARGFFGLG